MDLELQLYRLFLRFGLGRSSWHRRFYRPSVKVVKSDAKCWFQEGSLTIEAATLSSLKHTFSGRANVLLSGPSVKGIEKVEALNAEKLVCVNGSPAIFKESIPRFFLYHVNDTGYIRNNPKDFVRYAARAEWTLVDYRAVYLLLKLGLLPLQDTKLVVFENWGWPYSNGLSEIQKIANQPSLGEASLSLDPSLGLANAGTVAFTAAQALWHWGFEKVYFYGLDLNQSGRSYEEAKSQPQRLDKVYFRIIEPAFQLLVNMSGKDGIEFYNCSDDSRLPETIMAKVDLNQSLR
jgi:hypothetical protein